MKARVEEALHRPNCGAPITPLLHTKGQAAPETKAAVERAHLLIEQAEALGEPRRPSALFRCALWHLGRERWGIQWKWRARACGAVPDARRNRERQSRSWLGTA
jgi:hypothetical protein